MAYSNLDPAPNGGADLRLLAAIELLQASENAADLLCDIAHIVTNWQRRHVKFIGELDALNSVIDMAVRNPQSLVRLAAVVLRVPQNKFAGDDWHTEKTDQQDPLNSASTEDKASSDCERADGERTQAQSDDAERIALSRTLYQARYMKDRRRRLGKASDLFEASLGRRLSMSERSLYAAHVQQKWRSEREDFVTSSGAADWNSRNAAARDFWRLLEERLDAGDASAAIPNVDWQADTRATESVTLPAASGLSGASYTVASPNGPVAAVASASSGGGAHATGENAPDWDGSPGPRKNDKAAALMSWEGPEAALARCLSKSVTLFARQRRGGLSEPEEKDYRRHATAAWEFKLKGRLIAAENRRARLLAAMEFWLEVERDLDRRLAKTSGRNGRRASARTVR